MRKDIEFLHREAYLNEKQKRWDMENKSANTIIETFTAYIVQKLLFLIKENIKFQRFDELWFEAYSPDENEWVKGCPDFIGSLTHRETRFLFIDSSYAREEKLDKIVTIDDYNSINRKLSGCTRL